LRLNYWINGQKLQIVGDWHEAMAKEKQTKESEAAQLRRSHLSIRREKV
jgi:hypothetical protein